MLKNSQEVEQNHRRLSRRAMLLGGVQLAFIGALGGRMQYLQIKQSDQFRLLAEENRISVRLLPPERGEIFDRNGGVLARNIPNYRITIVREDAGDVDEVMRRLAQFIEFSDQDFAQALEDVKKKSYRFVPVTVAENLSWEELSAVSANAPALPGVTAELGLSRVYPQGAPFAHAVGYVGPVSSYDLERLETPDPVLRIPRFQLGKQGLEARAEELLRGQAGSRQVEVNAAGRVMRELERKEGRAGADVQLTLDPDLQNYAQARLGEESASVVVMDIETGDLLAVASAPSFDPNLFVRGISTKDYSELIENKYRPLAQKPVQDLYPPGSTFKMITALAALEDGIISPGETVFCPGHMDISGRRFHCWKRSGHGHVDLKDSLKESCDIYYYDLAVKVGIERISSMANRFGLGIRFDIPMSAVAQGLTPTREWKRRVHNEDWFVGDTVNVSIGQGKLLASPLQLCVMTARLASGRTIEPRLIKRVNGVEEPIRDLGPMGLSEANLRKMREAMYAVVNERDGTAYSSRIIADGMRMAGKTGTSQVVGISAQERARGITRNEDRPWERRDHALFVNYAPADRPKIAVSVIVQHGGGGSAVAAPIARDVTLQALYQGNPPLEAYPTKDRDDIERQQERLDQQLSVQASSVRDQA